MPQCHQNRSWRLRSILARRLCCSHARIFRPKEPSPPIQALRSGPRPLSPTTLRASPHLDPFALNPFWPKRLPHRSRFSPRPVPRPQGPVLDSAPSLSRLRCGRSPIPPPPQLRKRPAHCCRSSVRPLGDAKLPPPTAQGRGVQFRADIHGPSLPSLGCLRAIHRLHHSRLVPAILQGIAADDFHSLLSPQRMPTRWPNLLPPILQRAPLRKRGGGKGPLICPPP